MLQQQKLSRLATFLNIYGRVSGNQQKQYLEVSLQSGFLPVRSGSVRPAGLVPAFNSFQYKLSAVGFPGVLSSAWFEVFYLDTLELFICCIRLQNSRGIFHMKFIFKWSTIGYCLTVNSFIRYFILKAIFFNLRRHTFWHEFLVPPPNISNALF